MRLGAYIAELEPGSQVAAGLRRGGRVRAPPPPLRVQPPLPQPRSRSAGFVLLGHVARRPAGRVHRARRPPVLGRHPGPPRVQEPARTGRRRCSGSSSAPRSAGPRAATRTCSTLDAEPVGRGVERSLTAGGRAGVPAERRARASTTAASSRWPTGTFEAPDGATFERDVVHHPGAVSVVPLLDDGDGGAACASTGPPIDASCSRSRPASATSTASRRGDRPAGAGRGGRPAGRAARAAGRVPQLARASATSSSYDLPRPPTSTEVPPTCQGVEEQHMTIERVALDDVPGADRRRRARRRQDDHRAARWPARSPC